MIGLPGTDSVPRRSVPVNAMMANFTLWATLVAVLILSTLHVRRRLKRVVGERSGKSTRLLLDLPTRCKYLASAAIFFNPNVHSGQRWDSEPGFHRWVEYIVFGLAWIYNASLILVLVPDCYPTS